MNTNMINLWLDDERDPRDKYTQAAFGATGDEVWVKTAADAIAAIKSGNVASVSLDHDLGDVCNGTGMIVAMFIEFAAYEGTIPRMICRVHSMNPIGRKNMQTAIINAMRYWDKK